MSPRGFWHATRRKSGRGLGPSRWRTGRSRRAFLSNDQPDDVVAVGLELPVLVFPRHERLQRLDEHRAARPPPMQIEPMPRFAFCALEHMQQMQNDARTRGAPRGGERDGTGRRR